MMTATRRSPEPFEGLDRKDGYSLEPLKK